LNHRIEINKGILQAECSQMMVGFFKSRRLGK
jgi:hypothetical protein